MSFFTERCPNCAANISKQAEYCNACGCPSATSWTSCQRCNASIGGDKQFCWKCGAQQDLNARRAIYGDRWFRSAADFAVRVEVTSPEKVLHHGIQVDEGTLALVFQDGRLKGTLEPGYHTLDTFLQRLFGFDKGKQSHAILLDARSAEIDFFISDVRVKNLIPIDVRLRLLFRIVDASQFVSTAVRDLASFSTADLANLFMADVAEAVSARLRDESADDLMVAPKAREMVEESLMAHLSPILSRYGLLIDGVRLARFGGAAIDFIAEKLGEIGRLTRELEVNRELRDATREEKLAAYRDEKQLEDCYEQIGHEFGFKSAEREQERRKFLQAAEHSFQMDGLRQDFEARHAEILNRLNEQQLQHQGELREVEHELAKRGLRFQRELEESRIRGDLSREQQAKQAELDREVGIKNAEAAKLKGLEGLALAEKVEEFKQRRRDTQEAAEIKVMAQKLELFGAASKQALLATLTSEQADRVLKLAELEMREGLSAEQALALVAEKSPEIAPAVAEALKARYNGASDLAEPEFN